ncbi:MAG: DNA-binding protein [Oscillospiraceae bacterium]|nr:DNA-binding protein [Oscillospiraceae bacterium]
MPDERLYRSMLLDYYGDLLTPRQRECFELYYNEDLSLSEIAEQCGISRQGAWDNIRRASEAMERLEEKTGLLHRGLHMHDQLESLAGKLRVLEEQSQDEGMRQQLRAVLAAVVTLMNTEE